MASSSTGISPRMGLAIASAVTGLVLAGGASVASLVGWIGPVQAVTNTVQASTPERASLSANTLATEHGRSEGARVSYGERDDD